MFKHIAEYNFLYIFFSHLTISGAFLFYIFIRMFIIIIIIINVFIRKNIYIQKCEIFGICSLYIFEYIPPLYFFRDSANQKK